MNRLPLLSFFLLAALALPGCCRMHRCEVLVYGATPAGITAARAAALSGRSVVLVSPQEHVGGIVSGGLGYTDIGNKQAIEGLARDFYRRIGREYGMLERYTYEPHVAERVLEEMLRLPGIKLVRGARLLDLEKEGTALRSARFVRSGGPETGISAADTLSFCARVWIDASYCGDLLAQSGVQYIVGRESAATYGEALAGIRVGKRMMQLIDGIDPYRIKGDPSSGLLPGIEDGPVGEEGAADGRTQAYCYRCFLTNEAANRIPLSRPSDYDSTRYELALRILELRPWAQLKDMFIMRFMPNGKMEFNNRGGFSTDVLGINTDYPEAGSERRAEIEREHRSFTEGLFWFYATDPRVPEHIRSEMAEYGWCKDEFADNGNFPRQLYIREARRMVGSYVQTVADALWQTDTPDVVAYGSYGLDTHSVRRVVVLDENGRPQAKNEGSVGVNVERPYPISYRCLVPRAEECSNLLVPVCLSSSHVAYSSLRVEPCFMVLGMVSGLAAAQAVKKDISVQEVDAAALRRTLEEDPFLDGRAPDVVVDDPAAQAGAGWTRVDTRTSYGPSCLEHRGDPASGEVVFALPEGLDGTYELYSYEQKYSDRNGVSSALPDDLCQKKTYRIRIAGKEQPAVVFDGEDFTVLGQTAGDWWRLGSYRFRKGQAAEVRVSAQEEAPTRCDALLLVKKH